MHINFNKWNWKITIEVDLIIPLGRNAGVRNKLQCTHLQYCSLDIKWQLINQSLFSMLSSINVHCTPHMFIINRLTTFFVNCQIDDCTWSRWKRFPGGLGNDRSAEENSKVLTQNDPKEECYNLGWTEMTSTYKFSRKWKSPQHRPMRNE